MAQTATGDLLLFGSTDPITFDFPTMARRMANSPMTGKLADWGIDQPEELLGFFALSRDQAVQATLDVKPNTDTRLLSEVRLAGLIHDPEGEKSPYQWLQENESLDVLPYLEDDDAPEVLRAVAHVFLRWDWGRQFILAYTRLESVAPSEAAVLKAQVIRQYQ